MTLFSLNLTDLALSDKTHREDFFIGLFGTRAQAEAVAAHYLKQVPGFCDYDCTYRVEEKSIQNDLLASMVISSPVVAAI